MKFSIRDLLLVTMIVALAVGWGIDHRRQAEEIEDLQPLSYGFDARGNPLVTPRKQAFTKTPPKN